MWPTHANQLPLPISFPQLIPLLITSRYKGWRSRLCWEVKKKVRTYYLCAIYLLFVKIIYLVPYLVKNMDLYTWRVQAQNPWQIVFSFYLYNAIICCASQLKSANFIMNGLFVRFCENTALIIGMIAALT